MKIYPNIFAVIPDLPNMNEWLMVADDEWQKDPQTAKIYIFDEDEMYDLEEQGLAKIGEYFDEFPLHLEFENKPISIVEMATCYGDGKFVNHDKFTSMLKELDSYDANAVCSLAEGSSEINFEQLTLSKDEKEYLIYFGKFDMVFNAQN